MIAYLYSAYLYICFSLYVPTGLVHLYYYFNYLFSSEFGAQRSGPHSRELETIL